MHRIHGVVRDYGWGSVTAIPEFLDMPATGGTLAELWFGAHPGGPSTVSGSPDLDETDTDLHSMVAADPLGCLGEDVVARFGARLPYLLKLIAPARALSLQVHPSLEEARTQFALEEAAGLALTDPSRNYRDDNHKPELVVALHTFEALCGFRAPRRAVELLEGLDAAIARRLWQILHDDPSPAGMRTAFSLLLEETSRPTESEIAEFAAACAARLEGASPSPRADSTVVTLHEEHPGDPGVVASLLLNPVTLQPGEALFVPAGCVHAYLRGLGIEIMASSDNVLRAGLTSKHVDVPETLRLVDYVAAPPIRLAPEIAHDHTRMFYAPVDDFDLAITDVGTGADSPLPLPGRGPRVLVCIEGGVTLTSADGSLTLGTGDSAFVRAVDGDLKVHGTGTLVQAGVP